MKKCIKRIAAVLTATCLTLAAFTPAVAAETGNTANAADADTATSAYTTDTIADSTIPTIAEVTKESQETAGYLLKTNLESDMYSQMSDTSTFYNLSRNLFFALRSGVDCEANVNAYLASLPQYVNSDGALTINLSDYGYPNDIIACQAYLLNVLAAAGCNPADFNNINYVSAFSAMLQNTNADSFTYSTDPVTYENKGVNPYFVGVLYSTVYTYANQINDSSVVLNNIRTALNNISDENGVNYYGYSADNNGWVLPGFASLYSSDDSYKMLVNNAIAYTKQHNFDAATGAATVIDYSTGLPMPSCNSTGLAAALYSTFGYSGEAAMSYNALLTFASDTTPGAYTYYGTDSIFSTQDALVGLVSYQYILAGNINVYDTTKTVDFSEYLKPAELETNPSDDTTTASTEASEQTDTSVPTADTHSAAAYALILVAAIGCIIGTSAKKTAR